MSKPSSARATQLVSNPSPSRDRRRNLVHDHIETELLRMLHHDGRGGGGSSSGDDQPQRPSGDLTNAAVLVLNRSQQFEEPFAGEFRVPSHSSPPGGRKGLVKAERDSEGDRDDGGDVKFSRRHSEPSRRVSSSTSLKSRKKRSSPEMAPPNAATRGCIDINSSPAKKTSRASPTKRRRVDAGGRTSSTAATAHHATSRAAAFAAASAAAAASIAAPAASKGAGQTSSQLSDLIRRLPSPTPEGRWTFEMNAQLLREMQIHTTRPVTTATTTATAAVPTNTAATPPAAAAAAAAAASSAGLDAAAIAEAIMRQRGMAAVAQRFAHPESAALSPRFGSEAHARRFGWPEAWTERFGRPEAHAHRPGSEPLNRSLYEAAAALGAEGAAAAQGSRSGLSGQCKLSASHAAPTGVTPGGAASGAEAAAAATAAAATTTTRMSTCGRVLGSLKVRRSTSATAPVATSTTTAPAPATPGVARSAATPPTVTTTASATEPHPLPQSRPNSLARAAAAASIALPNFSLLSSIMAAAAASPATEEPPFHGLSRAHTAPPLRSNLATPSPLSPGSSPTYGAGLFPASSSVPGARHGNRAGPEPAGSVSLAGYPASRPSPSVAGAGAALAGAGAGAKARSGSAGAAAAGAGSVGAGPAGAAAGGVVSTGGNHSSNNNSNNDGNGMTVESLPVLRVSSDSSRMVVPRSAWAQGLVVDHMLGRGTVAAAPSLHAAAAAAAAAPAAAAYAAALASAPPYPLASAPSPPPTSTQYLPEALPHSTLHSSHQVFPPALLAHLQLQALQLGDQQGIFSLTHAAVWAGLERQVAALQPAGSGTVGEMAAAAAGPFSAAAAWAGLEQRRAAQQPAGADTAGGVAAATAGPFSAAAWAGLGRQAAALQPAGAGTGGDMAGERMAAATAVPVSAAAWAGLKREAAGAGTVGEMAGSRTAAATASHFSAAALAGLGPGTAVLQPAGAGTEVETAGRGMAAATANPFPGGAGTPILQGSREVATFGPGRTTLQGKSSQGVQAERGSKGEDGREKEGDREEPEGVYIFGQLISPRTQ